MLLAMLPRKGWLYLAVIAALTHHSHSSSSSTSLRSAMFIFLEKKLDILRWSVCVRVFSGEVPQCREIHLVTSRTKSRQTNKLHWRKEANNEPPGAISRQMPSRTQRKVNSSKLAVHPLRIQYYTYHPVILSVSYAIQASLLDSTAPAQIKVSPPPLLWFYSRAAAVLSCDSLCFSHNKRPPTQTGG